MSSRIVIVGAGIVGAATALTFAERGFRVAVVDQADHVAAGTSGARNVYVNCGHGMLGWTLAAGTAERVADMITTIADPVIEPAAAQGARPQIFLVAIFTGLYLIIQDIALRS